MGRPPTDGSPAPAHGPRPPEILSTHPSSENRAQRLRELMPEAMAFYDAAPVQYGLGERL